MNQFGIMSNDSSTGSKFYHNNKHLMSTIRQNVYNCQRRMEKLKLQLKTSTFKIFIAF